jgi:type II secretory pathway predicted ATPase ExeA
MSTLNNDHHIVLKEVLRRAGVGYRTLKKMLDDEHISVSLTTIGDLQRYNRVPRRFKTAAFEEFIRRQFAAEIADIGIEDIWAPYEGELTPVKTMSAVSPYEKLLKKILEEKAMLNQEVLAYFKLTKNPFLPLITKESEIYLSTWHLYALDMLRETAANGGFSIITGQVGSGKTTVLLKFLEENRTRLHHQIIRSEAGDKRNLQPRTILEACVYDMTNDRPKQGIEALTRQVRKLLLARAANNERVMLIIDEAHDMPVATIKFLKRLWEMENGLQRLIGIALIGQNELEETMYGKGAMELREVTARAVHAKLSALGEQAANYILHRVKSAGGHIDKIITKDALDKLPAVLADKDRTGKLISAAYPLHTNRVMMGLMTYAYDNGFEVITPEVITGAGYGRGK